VPIYEYRCPNGHTFEVFQRMSDPSPEGCAICAAGPVEKVLFPVAVHFKGSGFYSTDYGRGARKTSAKEVDGASAGDKGKSADSSTTDKSSGEKKASTDTG
jgi:putative FmdB family regulatory protein